MVVSAEVLLQESIIEALRQCMNDGSLPLSAVPDDIVIEKPKNPSHGDWSTNAALRIVKHLPGRTPMDIAQTVVAHIPEHTAFSSMEVVPPGFINARLSEEFIAAQLQEMYNSPRLGVPEADDPLTVVVDYSAPNVAKEMHVGHLRSTIIGDALTRILTFLGHTVIRENHIGDWGTPFGMLIEHLIDVGDAEGLEELSVGELGAFYRQARTTFEGNPAFQERSRRRVVLLQSGDPATLKLWRTLVDASLDAFETIYSELGVLLTREDVAGESQYNDGLAQVVSDLRSWNLLVESDGAQCVFPPGFFNRDGSPLPLIIQKSDGGYGYAATDLATIRDRVDRLHADRMLYVVGMPQSQHFAMVFAVASMAGWLPSSVEATHVAFGHMLGTDHKMFKSRSGNTFQLQRLIDEAVDRARTAVVERNPELGREECESIARMVGIGAMKYADLSNDRTRDYVFDLDRMLSFEGNTAPYLQYAHARIRSVFRKGNVSPADTVPSLPAHAPAERALALHILSLESVLADVARSCRPHTLCTYLYELSSLFTAFYEQCPILKAATPDERAVRLALAHLTGRVLHEGLGLLGIAAPDQM